MSGLLGATPNLFDKHYYKSVGYTDNANILGAPRSFMLTGTYKF